MIIRFIILYYYFNFLIIITKLFLQLLKTIKKF